MEEKETLVINCEELKSILAKHYFWLDYQTKEDCYKTTSLGIKCESEEVDQNQIRFILRYEKKIDEFDRPIKKEYIITKPEVINVINKILLNEGYEIDNFDCNIIYGLNNNSERLNFISLKLKKIRKIKTLKRGWKRNV